MAVFSPSIESEGCITAMIELPIFGNSSRLYGHVNRSCKMLCLATTRRSLAIWPMNLTIGRRRCIGIRSRKTSGHDTSFSCSSIVQANLLKEWKEMGLTMKIRLRILVAVIFTLVSASAFSQEKKPSASAAAAQPLLGGWDLTLKAPDREYPSWLELSQDGGQLKARLVSRWGHARFLPKVKLSNGHIMFVSPKEEEDRKDDMVFEGRLAGKMLVGTTTGQDGTPWTWTGRRAPSLKRSGPPGWAKPVALFSGKDLAGWKMSDPASKVAWTVENGVLTSPGHGPELISEAKFQDFKLHIEFNCGRGANSGVYLRGRYELQVEDDPVPEAMSQRTGGVYGFLAPSPEAPRKPGEWQTYDVTLLGRMVTVALNGQTIIDNQEIPGITGGALDAHEELPGPIYLQGSEAGHVAYRNIVITPER